MIESRRRNSLIVTIPLVAVAIAWVFLVFLPIHKAIGRLQEQSRDMQQYREQSYARLPVLKRTGRGLADIRRTIARWNDTTPSRHELTVLLGKLTALARSAGLQITRFDPEPVVAHDRLGQAPLSMRVTGPFASVFGFLAKVESLPRIIWVDDLEIEKPEKTGENVSCSLRLSIFVDKSDISDQRNDSDNR
jgi:Tfp pilus assembly protein PilO